MERSTWQKKAFGYPLKFALPIVFGFGKHHESIILNNGTVSLVNFGQGKFYITCFHVFESFLEKLNNMERDEKPLLQVGNLSIKNRPEIIDESNQFDLITIKVNDSEHKQMINGYSHDTGDSFIENRENGLVTLNDQVAFGGFPGSWRDKVGPNQVKFCSFGVSLVNISAVKNNEIICQLDDVNNPTKWEKFSGIKRVLENPGGLSGGPVFVMKNTPIVHWNFVGIVREGFIFDQTLFVYVTRINCINPDGTING